ncbi:hypothetical protein WICPIJ_010064 [Wickerhamomyces pijperi]|uniref:Uncharacterized protein n=1 Tax=Wickerhamomyces pijperi TaxID=599730 RepID=A0A9P8TB77_WICPI|nr:hypothetical protein WICPIJ_010064 [Wickerhamomyces pijperi]
MTFKTFLDHMSWMFFRHITDYDRLTLFKSVPELETEYYTERTTRVVLIFCKESQPIPKSFASRYGKCNRFFVKVPDQFAYGENNAHTSKRCIEQIHDDLQGLIPTLKDLVSRDSDFDGHLLVEFAFDMDKDSIYHTSALYAHLFDLLNGFDHSLNIYKSNTELHMLTKSRDRRMTLFDAINKIYPTTKIGLERDLIKNRELYIKLRSPLIPLRNGKLLRSTVLFDGFDVMLREDIADLRTSRLKGINIITPCNDWSQDEQFIKAQAIIARASLASENKLQVAKEINQYTDRSIAPLGETVFGQYKRRKDEIEGDFYKFIMELERQRHLEPNLQRFENSLYTDPTVIKALFGMKHFIPADSLTIEDIGELYFVSEVMFKFFNSPSRRALRSPYSPEIQAKNKMFAQSIQDQCKFEYIFFHQDALKDILIKGEQETERSFQNLSVSPRFKEITIFGDHHEEPQYDQEEIEMHIIRDLRATAAIAIDHIYIPIVSQLISDSGT